MARNLVGLVALLLDAAACALLWGRLPERVPMHWNLHGEVDRWGSRTELVFWGLGGLAVLWLVLAVAYRLDPRQRARRDPEAPVAEQGARRTVEAMTLALLAGLHMIMLTYSAGLLSEPLRPLALGLAVMQLLFGNWMGRVRSNFFVGIRTPWTLSSEAVWRRTHRLAARMLVVGGLLSVPLALSLPGPRAMMVSAGLLMLGTLGPAVASWFFWHAEETRGSH